MSGLSANTRALVGLRLLVGVSSWLFPNFVAKAFGVDPKSNPQGPYIMRLFAVRDIVLGVGVLTSRGEARKNWLRMGVACDAADLAAAVSGHRAGYLSTTTAVMGGAAAAGAVAGGLAAVSEDDAVESIV